MERLRTWEASPPKTALCGFIAILASRKTRLLTKPAWAPPLRLAGKSRPGYHLHLQPQDETLIAGGLYLPTPEQLARFRMAIDQDAASFKVIVEDKEFKKYFGMLGGEKVKTVPQGYTRDHPEIELLRFKQVVVVHRLSDEIVLSPRFSTQVIKTFTAMKPFLDYLN